MIERVESGNKKKKKKKLEPTKSEEIFIAPPPTEPEPTYKPKPTPPQIATAFFDIYCEDCGKFVKVLNMSLDAKGILMANLQCKHKVAYELKVELYGEKALQRFGK